MLCMVFNWFGFFFLMIRRPPKSTRTDTLFPYTTLFRSCSNGISENCAPIIGRPFGLAAEQIGKSRSEEHTSELQSLMRISYAVFCLKKKNEKFYSHHCRKLSKRTKRDHTREHSRAQIQIFKHQTPVDIRLSRHTVI